MIPKIIHYCWLSDDPIPEKFLEYQKQWKEVLKDYEFVLWDRTKFDVDSVLWTKQAFSSKKYAFAADYIRLYAVYTYGGIYLDMDVDVKKDFSSLLNQNLMLGFENIEKSGIEAGCFGAEKNSDYIKRCLSYYENRSFIKEDGSFDVEVLPKIMKSFLTTEEVNSVETCDYFTAKSFFTGKIKITENTFAVHNFAGSWTTEYEQKFYLKRQKLSSRFGIKAGKILSAPYFILWQIKDFGIKKVFEKSFKRVKKWIMQG